MALNVEVGHITQPGGTGNQTYNLPASFDPKALILVATPLAADGVTAHASMCVGFATDRGGTPQQYCSGVFAEDNIGTSDTYRWNDDDIALRLVDATGAVDLEATFVEFTTTTWVLNWTNLHTTGSVRINYMVLGGDDVEDAQAHSFSLTTGSGAFDVTLGSGFGHPDLVLFMRIAEAADSGVISGADLGLGFGILGGDDRSVWWGSADNAATEASFQRIDNDSALIAGAGGSIETDITLAAEAGFPTDGYEVTKATSSFASEGTNALALRLSSDVTIASGGGSMRTTTGDTDLAVGTSTPKGLILLHTRQTTAGSTDTTSTDAAELGIGLVDGAGNERWAGIWDDDGQATASVASSAQVDDKALRVYTPSTDALDGEADCTISGSNFRLTTGDAFSAAFLYQWLALGVAGSGPETTPDVGQVTAAGITPTATTTITPAVATASAAGTTPNSTTSITAATGTVSVSGISPTVTINVTATAATVTAAGTTPNSTTSITPTSGTVDVTGIAPTEIGPGTPTPGTVTVTGISPTVTNSTTPVAATVDVAGTASSSNTHTSGTTTVTLAGTAPTSLTQATPAPATVTATPASPNQTVTATSTVGLVTVAGIAPFDPLSVIPDPHPVHMTITEPSSSIKHTEPGLVYRETEPQT